MLQRSLKLVVLVDYPGAQGAALNGLADLFAIANTLRGVSVPLDVVRLGPELAEQALHEADSPAAIILPPTLSEPCEISVPEHFAQWLRDAHGKGACLVSICVGTFLLARSGVLDGRVVAAHWGVADTLSRTHPAVTVDAGRLLMDEGDLLTSAGIMSWPDIGLRLVERFLGPVAMLETARFLLIDPPRTEQRVYQRFTPAVAHGDEPVARVQAWLATEAFRKAQVSDMAHVSGLEERTFLRRFQKGTGMTPVEYLQGLRVEHGRRRLEEGGLAVDRIAWEVGYQDAGAFRKIFLRVTGLSPATYRKRFGAHVRV